MDGQGSNPPEYFLSRGSLNIFIHLDGSVTDTNCPPWSALICTDRLGNAFLTCRKGLKRPPPEQKEWWPREVWSHGMVCHVSLAQVSSTASVQTAKQNWVFQLKGPTTITKSICWSVQGWLKVKGAVQVSSDTDRPGASNTSLGSLFQSFTTLLVKKCFLLSSLILSWHSFEPFPMHSVTEYQVEEITTPFSLPLLKKL